MNFLHGSSPDAVREYFKKLIQNNKIQYIVVDRMIPAYNQRYSHDYESVLKEFGFALEYASRGFKAAEERRRHFYIFKKENNNEII